MAKRFTDTGKWAKESFSELSLKMKLVWIYLCDNCNHAGIWDINLKLISFQIGEEIGIEDLKNGLKDKIIFLENKKIFIPTFVDFQYGELNDANRAHKSVIDILKKEGAFEGLNRSLQGRKDKEKDKDKDNKGGVGGNGPDPVPKIKASFNPSSPDEILSNMPVLNVDLWRSLYPQEFLNREAMLCIAYWLSADPGKKPQTRGAWAQKLGSWFESAWQKEKQKLPKTANFGIRNDL